MLLCVCGRQEAVCFAGHDISDDASADRIRLVQCVYVGDGVLVLWIGQLSEDCGIQRKEMAEKNSNSITIS